jgi:hypothetical protein
MFRARCRAFALPLALLSAVAFTIAGCGDGNASPGPAGGGGEPAGAAPQPGPPPPASGADDEPTDITGASSRMWRAKWVEGKQWAARIKSQIKVWLATQPRKIEPIAGRWGEIAAKVGGSPEMRMQYFEPRDFIVSIAADRSWEITVDGDNSHEMTAPGGRYVIDSAGNEYEPY